MNSKRIKRPAFLLILPFFYFFTTCCYGANFITTWPDHEMVIDGKYTNFGNSKIYYDDKNKIAIRLVNDNEYLYVCITSQNKKLETQIVKAGLMLWLDPKGGKRKGFGIHFPLVSNDDDQPVVKDNDTFDDMDWSDQGNDFFNESPKKNNGNEISEKQLEVLEALQDRLEIMIPSANGKLMPVALSLDEARQMGIEAKVDHENGVFVYELKVPLSGEQHQYSIGARIGRPIGLGLEIPALKTKSSGGGGAHMGGGGIGMVVGLFSQVGRSMSSSSQSKAIQIWGTVKLSLGPSI